MSEKNYRRIVTGHDGNGRSKVIEDAPAKRVTNFANEAGATIVDYWVHEQTPVPISAEMHEAKEDMMSLPPPSAGAKFRVIEFQPGNEEKLGELPDYLIDQIFERFGAQPTRVEDEGGHPLMHRNEGIDYGIMLEGELVMLLDEEEVTMEAGDVAIQCGTSHAWSNRSDKLARIAFVQIGGKFDEDLKAKF